jgi:uncharacterized protein (TIGR02145 family)
MRIKSTLLVLIAITVCYQFAHAQAKLPSVKIGTQVWSSKNLDVDKFRNGDPIPEVKTKNEWLAAGKAGKPAWCYYNNDPKNGKKYGKLYNWYAVNDPRGLAPKGWHIPTIDEWDVLLDFVDDEKIPAEVFKSKTDWKEYKGNNKTGLSCLPSGIRSVETGEDFESLGEVAGWWSSSEKDNSTASAIGAFDEDDEFDEDYGDKKIGLAVRCIKD